MRWLAAQIETTHEASELISDFLTALGAVGVETIDATEFRDLIDAPDSLAYADDGWLDAQDLTVRMRGFFAVSAEGVRVNRDDQTLVAYLYDDVPKTVITEALLKQKIESRLKTFRTYQDIGRGLVGLVPVAEEDWAENWKQHYQTQRLTARIVINPSWQTYEPQTGEYVITLDPGSAFGTGEHETTAMCAQLLDEVLMPGDAVLDLGCGSGILAIISRFLGAGSCEAIDIDPHAVNVAMDNCARNQIAVDVHVGELCTARRPQYDLIIANIIADVLIRLMPEFPERLASDGLLILSGIIADRIGDVCAAADTAGLIVVREIARGDWRALLLSHAGEQTVHQTDGLKEGSPDHV